MIIINSNFRDLVYLDDLAIAIGNFDGIHLGHQLIIKALKSTRNLKKAILVFEPNTRQYFSKDKIFLISTLQDKIDYFTSQNIHYFIIVKFDNDLINLTPNDFIKKLIEIGVKKTVVGNNFRFGVNNSGDSNLLSKSIPTKIIDVNEEVSSSQIRISLMNGDIPKGNALLGYPFFIKGSVIKGKGIGKTLGFPTLNIDYDNYHLLPNGVYAVKVFIKGLPYIGLANIGVAPTVKKEGVIVFEVHVLNFHENVYGEKVKVEFYHKVRNEIKFSSLEELIDQIRKDLIKVTSLFNS